MRYVLQIIGLTFFLVLISKNIKAHEHSLDFPKTWKMIGTVDADNFHGTMKELTERGFDIAGVSVKEKKVDLLLSDVEFRVLKSLGYKVEITQIKGVNRGPDQEYQNPSEVEAYVKKYNNLYPNLTKLVSIGKSLEGRDIWALKISDNANENEVEEPTILYNSMHHAREVMTPEMGLDIIEYLLDNYDTNSQVKSWVNENQFWIIPMFNVDGNNKMWNDDSFWRKNTRGGYGVDLNRNYPQGWNSCNGSSGSQSSQTYRGPKPASEPETRAMMDFIAEHRPVFDISYHSYSELVIYPYGCKGDRAETYDVVEKIGKEIARLIDYEPGTAWELLYNADGGDIDWMYAAYQVIPYVIELNSRWQGFHPKYNRWRDKTVQRNRDGWQYLIQRAHESGIRGQVRLNGQELSEYNLNVYKVTKGERVKYQEYIGHRNGVFHLVLNPGTYELEFEDNGAILGSETIDVDSSLLWKSFNF
jgi:carboxypeptidase T